MPRLSNFIVLFLMLPLFEGCDNGASSSDAKVSSEVRGSASSNRVSESGCEESVCYLFKDGMEDNWGLISAFELQESIIANYYFEGNNGSHVQWQLVNTGDVHNQVIQATFNANDPFDEANDNGWIGLSVGTDETQYVNLSEFAKGAVLFDMRVIQNGKVPNNFDFKIECIYPCTSAQFALEQPSELLQWKTYTFTFPQLIETGLDITHVNNLFIFKPLWGEQQGQYIVQLDNIRFAKNN